MLFLAPLPLVPVLVAAGFMLGRLRDFVGATTAVTCCRTSPGTWFALGPVWVLAALAPGAPPALESVWIYALAFAAQVLVGTAAALDAGPPRE